MLSVELTASVFYLNSWENNSEKAKFGTCDFDSVRGRYRRNPRARRHPFGRLLLRAERMGRLMTIACPQCQGIAIVAKRHAQQTAATLGGVAGAIRGVSTAWDSGELMDAPSILGVPVGLIAGVVVGGLLGGAAGCAAGSAIGEAVDHSLPNNLACQTCGHLFGPEQGKLSSS